MTTQNLTFPEGGVLLDFTYDNSQAVVNSANLKSKPFSVGAVFYIHATTNGSAQLKYVDSAGVAFSYGSATSVTANTLATIVITNYLPNSYIAFTPAASVGTVHIEGYPYGANY